MNRITFYTGDRLNNDFLILASLVQTLLIYIYISLTILFRHVIYFISCLDMSKMLRNAHKPKAIDKQAKEKAEQLFVDHNMVVIVGSSGSGKTSLSFDLLSSYDLSNGDENFLVISDPGELKYVKLAFHPVIIIKFFTGGKYDQADAWKWYNQFDRLYAGVQANQIAVITTIDSKVFQKMPATILQHPVLKHIVQLQGSPSKGSEDLNEGKSFLYEICALNDVIDNDVREN